jgi:hypothetical protein
VDDGTFVAVQADRDLIQFVARGLPGLGYRTYVASTQTPPATTATCDETTHTLVSPHFSVELDPATGSLRSLTDAQGRQWADSTARPAFGQFLYERFDRDQVAAYVKAYVKISADWALNELGKPDLPPSSEVPYEAHTPTDCQVRYETSPVSVTAILDAPANVHLRQSTTTRVTVYRDLPCVDIALTLHDKPADPWPEAGWLCFPVQADSPRFRLGRLGALVDPAQDLVPGANHNLFGINTGVAVLDKEGRGLGICPLDSPLVSLDQPGCWKYDPEFQPRRAHVFVNLFNNQWTTNFRYWNEGTWTTRVRIWSLDEGKADESLTVTSLEARYPLLASIVDAPAGSLPAAQEGLSVSRKGTLVTAFGTDPCAGGTVLRLWELAGNSGDCELRLPSALHDATMTKVNLRGEPVAGDHGALSAPGDKSVQLTPFAPVSLLLMPDAQ